jgi:hypothetical protein
LGAKDPAFAAGHIRRTLHGAEHKKTAAGRLLPAAIGLECNRICSLLKPRLKAMRFKLCESPHSASG